LTVNLARFLEPDDDDLAADIAAIFDLDDEDPRSPVSPNARLIAEDRRARRRRTAKVARALSPRKLARAVKTARNGAVGRGWRAE
jgi:hypothetical protein